MLSSSMLVVTWLIVLLFPDQDVILMMGNRQVAAAVMGKVMMNIRGRKGNNSTPRNKAAPQLMEEE